MLFYLLSVLGLVPTSQKTKCKKLLSTTMERIKLLEKRRQARLRQLHRDVIELLQCGKEHKVQPCLERIWKELCLFSVHNKIAEYCQFVQINLQNIAGQGECPRVLKEPVAGLCFAASCCAELPELQELREIFAMKYGKQFVNSAQELRPSCHINQQFLECLCAKNPSETRKQALLEQIIAQYNVKQGHEQDTLQQETHVSLSSIEGFLEANDSNGLQEVIDDTIKASEVKDQSESEELQEAIAVQESNHIESTVCKEDLDSSELTYELANRKRTLQDRDTHRSPFKRANRRRRFWLNKSLDEEEHGGEDHAKTTDKAHDCVNDCQQDEVCGDAQRNLAIGHHNGALEGQDTTPHMNQEVAPNANQCILPYGEQSLLSQSSQRTSPPIPPPKQAPPPLPSLRMVSMPSFYNDKQGIVNRSLPLSSSTMANNYFLETYGNHVHPRLPKYEDLVANFTARKH